MIRKAIIVVLMAGAVGTIALEALSYRTPMNLPGLPLLHTVITDKAWLFVGTYEGQVKVSIWQSDEPKALARVRNNPTAWWVFDDAPETFYFEQHRRRRSPLRQDGVSPILPLPFPMVTADIGFPIWSVFALFVAYPTLAFIRGPLRRRRRRRQGLCIRCGYNLTGNVTGVCPECGAKT